MAKGGGGIGRISLAPSDEILAQNIARVEGASPQDTDGPFGSTKSGARTFEIRSVHPHREAYILAEALSSGAQIRILDGKGWVADFGSGSAVTYRYTTETVKGMPGVTLSIRDGRSRAVYEIHYLPKDSNEN